MFLFGFFLDIGRAFPPLSLIAHSVWQWQNKRNSITIVKLPLKSREASGNPESKGKLFLILPNFCQGFNAYGWVYSLPWRFFNHCCLGSRYASFPVTLAEMNVVGYFRYAINQLDVSGHRVTDNLFKQGNMSMNIWHHPIDMEFA